MEFKAYYYLDEEKCIICKKETNSPNFSDVNNNKSIIIDLKSKNVENIYDFFRNNIFFAILNNKKNISIDFSGIESEEFYSEDSFIKLCDLINELLIQSNDSILECIDDKSNIN